MAVRAPCVCARRAGWRLLPAAMGLQAALHSLAALAPAVSNAGPPFASLWPFGLRSPASGKNAWLMEWALRVAPRNDKEL